MNEIIRETTLELLDYIESENYSGYDPYDALQSPLFSLPGFRSQKHVRFLSQQLIKRLPLNIRPLLGIKKGKNPVTLGLSVQAYGYLMKAFPYKREVFQTRAYALIDELVELIPNGYSGACWGYEFDWEARNAKIPKYQPTVVATGIITNGLFEYHLIDPNPKCTELILSASNFVAHDLNRTIEEERTCFSYSPFDKQKVYNACAKAVRLLAQAHHLSESSQLIELARSGVDYIVGKQNPDGSWYYADSEKSKWIDSYHTGYVLDCLDAYQSLTGDRDFSDAIQKGFKYFRETFINQDFTVRTYSDRTFPIDCTSVGQVVLTLCRFGDIKMAEKVLENTVTNMYDRKGKYFFYRKNLHYILRTSFMRWSQAWMIVAFGNFLFKELNENLV